MSSRRAAVRTKHGRQAWRRRHYPHDHDGGQRQRWWSGGDFQCPPLQRQAGGRNLTVIELEPCQLFATTISKSVSSSSSSDIGTTSSGIDRPRTPNNNVVFIRNKVKYEGWLIADTNSGGGGSQRPALQRAGGKRFTVIDREPSTVPSTNSTASIATAASSDAASVIDAPSKLGEAEEIGELVSSLKESKNQNEDTIQHLQQQLSKMESQNEVVKAERHNWKTKHARMERLDYEMIEKMAAKAFEQLHSHSDTVQEEADYWKGKYEQMGQLSDELVEKIGGIAEENGQLHIKCHQLEEDERKLNDMLIGKTVDLANESENEKLECELVSSEASFETSHMQDAASTITNSRSLSGDVYEQLDQFEHSLDVELEDFQQLGSLGILSVVVMMASSGENEKDTSANNSEGNETYGSESKQAPSS